MIDIIEAACYLLAYSVHRFIDILFSAMTVNRQVYPREAQEIKIKAVFGG